MNRKKKSRVALLVFAIVFVVAVSLFIAAILKTNAYNKTTHEVTFSGPEFFSQEAADKGDVSVIAIPRDSTWSKAFDFNNEGITEHNYMAYTYDFTVSNNTKDEVSDFSFKVNFNRKVFLMSAWNGSLEIHQNRDGKETVETIPDLRDFNPGDYDFEIFTVDGENLVALNEEDYFVYKPSSSVNALEVPIGPEEATTPGVIMYVGIGEDISGTVLSLNYRFHRLYTREPLFWISLAIMAVWLIALLIFIITSLQIRKYQIRHEHDNRIINESIETFTGFIDAKDTYTNGHSKRVAIYTRRIAQEFGYSGEELDRIYYVALLHDCGKIGVPDHILGKPGRLTDEEFEIIKSHTVRGGDILSSFKSLEGSEEGALYHHERYDGNGYPKGLAGEDIPFVARMICVADSFDAMNSNRVYRNRLTKEDIIEEIEKNKGKQFDPKIADVFLELYKNDELEALDIE